MVKHGDNGKETGYTAGLKISIKSIVRFVNNLGKRIKKVSIVNEGDCIKVTPKTWIDKHIWRKINDILRLHEFSWLSNGKDSCWLKMSLWFSKFCR